MALQRTEVYRINRGLVEWAESVAQRTKPEKVVWCDGTEREYWLLINQMVEDGTLIELDQLKYPGCYLHRSKPFDVARTEASTFICTPLKDDAGPTNNWMNDKEAETLLWKIFDGCMKGRTMYIVPYLMGPVESPYSQAGVQLTDSPYVVANLKIMTRMGLIALERLKDGAEFVKGIHSQGTMNPEQRYICHFPDTRLIMSINSNYGGNALLSKKCHSLRIAGPMAREEGWLAEHMLIVGVEDPSGKTTYITGAFPSASGKTNLAMLKPPVGMEEYKVLTVGDDIAWLHLGPDGFLRGINPEAGFFCVAPNSSPKTNPNLLETISKNTIFTNVALTTGGTPWWEGYLPSSSPIIDWQGRPWTPGGAPAAHPNSRFTAPISQYPQLSPRADDPEGVPISAILFGGRRARLIPLVTETFSWEHGVLVGAMMKVETTAAAEGAVGMLRNDPMAMIPFCGYNMGDYFRHWLSFAGKSKSLPRIYQVNWFRTGSDGKFLWPGYRENLRVLRWIVDRINGKAEAVETPIGYVPAPGSIDLDGLNLSTDTVEELFHIDRRGWLDELKSSEEFFKSLGSHFPEKLWEEHHRLVSRLQA